MWRKLISGIVAVGIVGLLAFGQEIKNPDTLIFTTYGPAETLDPAFSYDTASGEIIFNVYENLVRWPYGIVDADEVDLSHSLDPADLMPMLSTNVPESLEIGGELFYTFNIRQGVKFHEGGILTPEDVEYTFERGMLQDRDGGPQWMLLEPLTGFGTLRDVAAAALGREVDDLHTLTPAEQALIYNEYIDPAVEVSGNTVTFRLPKPYPPFLTILAHGGGWGAILDKEWCIEVAGCWDGQPTTWEKWWNPGGGEAAEASELYDIANGTGPFKLARWDIGIEVVFERFDDYWGEPAKLKNAVIRKTEEWSDRLLMFQNADADLCQVDPQYRPQVIGSPGIVYQTPLPTLSMNPVAFFTAPVVLEGNQLAGEGPWDGYGIPADFFADVDVRKAFCLAFDYDTYIEEVLLGTGYKTHGPIPQAFEWAYNPDPDLLWEYDPEAATELMKQARGGEIWEKGFNLTLVYNEGNDARRVSAEILEANLEAMNPKFQIEVRALPWPTQLSLLVTQRMPIFIIGWLADFPDPHNFAVPFVVSYGTFSGWQGDYMVENIYKPMFDPLVEAGMATTDLEERAEIYYEISRLAHEYAIDLWLPQLVGYRFVRDWVQDYPFNPIYPGPYFYPMYKAYE
jgi:peptide/nickel transport system substrate-binding protein